MNLYKKLDNDLFSIIDHAPDIIDHAQRPSLGGCLKKLQGQSIL